MDEQWRRFGLPSAMMLAACVWIFSWSRLYYGLDLIQESRHVLYQLDLLVHEGFFRKELGLDQLAQLLVYPFFRLANELTGRLSSEGIVLHLRELKLGLSWLFALLLGFVFRHRVAPFATLLFAAPLVSFVPLNVMGVHPLSMASLLGVTVVASAWRWMQAPTAVKSWILPLTGFLLGVACPETLPVLVLGVLAMMLRPARAGEDGLVKMHLAASLNLAAFLAFLAVREINPEGFREAWHVQNNLLGWKGVAADAWVLPGGHMGLVFLLSLVFAFVLPARFFHFLFAALAMFFAIVGWPQAPYPAEFIIVLMSPLVLSHFWKIRASLPEDFKPGFLIAASLSLALVLGFTRGLPGVAVGLFPLMIFFFASGWVRDVKWPVLVSAFCFSMLLVVAQYQRMPEGQTRMASLDEIKTGRYQGLWTTRPISQEIESVTASLERLPPGPVSLLVYPERPGYYLLSELDALGFLYRFPVSTALRDETVAYFSGAENLPDVTIRATSNTGTETSGLGEFFENRADYQLFEATPRYQIHVKKEFVENAMNRL
ncbi:MAG: hypothetical protein KF767_17510 [Bdellovibrionaceae bacterium]|nr:hypothetical protein [Pseudobdellovibrionaceae bacterium]